MDPIIPEGLIKTASIDIYSWIMIGIGVVVAFLLVVAISKNLVNMAWSFNIGLSLKLTKKYRRGDIIRYNSNDWLLDVLNTYRIKFKQVIEVKDNQITLSDKELSISYVDFLKMKILRVGHFGL